MHWLAGHCARSSLWSYTGLYWVTEGLIITVNPRISASRPNSSPPPPSNKRPLAFSATVLFNCHSRLWLLLSRIISSQTQKYLLAIGDDKQVRFLEWPPLRMKTFLFIDIIGTDITWAKLEELKYLSNVIKESMRLHPVEAQVGRESAQDDTLGGDHIPINTHFLIGIHVIHRSEKYWPDPDTFKPQRFENLSK